jgi:hypothetical protein
LDFNLKILVGKKKGIWLKNGKSSSLTSAILLVTCSFQIFKFLEIMIELPFFINSKNYKIHRMHPCKLVLFLKTPFEFGMREKQIIKGCSSMNTTHSQGKETIFYYFPTQTLKGAHWGGGVVKKKRSIYKKILCHIDHICILIL